MKVDCFSVDEFLEDIRIHVEQHGSEGILQKAVRVSISKRPFENCDFKKKVFFQASAVIVLPDGGEYLLQMGQDCGVDYEDSSKEYTGTNQAHVYLEKVNSYCLNSGLTVRPGVIGI